MSNRGPILGVDLGEKRIGMAVSDPGTSSSGKDRGTVHLFQRGPGGWVEQDIIEFEETKPADYFGLGLVLGDGLLAICARVHSTEVTGSGALYLFSFP